MPFDLEQVCRALLETHAHAAAGVTLHLAEAPGPLVTWTSAHAALALRHLDPAAACAELRALYALCQRQNGLLARAQSLVPTAREPDDHGFIDPPFAAYVVARLAQDGQLVDDALLECATRQVDAIWEERLPPDSSLPVILHPVESATPYSPCFDPIIESLPGPEWDDEVGNIARSAHGCQLDPARAIRAGHPFVVEDPGFCGWLLIALEALSQVWEQRRSAPAALRLRVRSSMIRDAIEERLWWPLEEIYTPYDRGRDEPLRGVAAGGLVPLASRTLLAEGSAKRAIDRYLRPSGSCLWGPLGLLLEPVRGTPAVLSAHSRGGLATLVHYWAHTALVAAGRGSDARVARTQLEALLEAQGPWERYEPTTGAGLDGSGSLLAALALEMRAAD
jgi:hypothetical protein